MKVKISELSKLKDGQGKSAILVDNFLELAILEDRQSKGEKFEIIALMAEVDQDATTIPEKCAKLSAVMMDIYKTVQEICKESQQPEHNEGWGKTEEKDNTKWNQEIQKQQTEQLLNEGEEEKGENNG